MHVLLTTLERAILTVYGYVGNKAAILPLQMHGIEADPCNSVQFSNHAAYKVFKGYRHTEEDLNLILEGLRENEFLEKYTDVVYGYLGTQGVLNSAIRAIKEIKTKFPNTFFLCDPVLGDNRKLYVPQCFVENYREMVVPLADAVTPNQTELELLTESGELKSMKDAIKAIRKLHSLGPKIVLVTSLVFDDDDEEKEQGQLNRDSQSSDTSESSLDSQTDEFVKKYLVNSGNDTKIESDSQEGYRMEYDIRVDASQTYESMRMKLMRTSDPAILNQVIKLPVGDTKAITCGSTVLSPKRPMYVLASIKSDESDTQEVVVMRVPMYEQFLSGTGDTVSSLLLSRLRGQMPGLRERYVAMGDNRLSPDIRALGDVVAAVMAAMNDVIRWTIASGRGELTLVQRRHSLVAAKSLCEPVTLPDTQSTESTVVEEAIYEARKLFGEKSIPAGLPHFISIPVKDLNI